MKLSLKDRLHQDIKKENLQEKKEINKSVLIKDPSVKKEHQKIQNLGVIDPLIYENEINAIFVSGAKNIYVLKNDKIQQAPISYKDDFQLENLIKSIVHNYNITFDKNNPYFKFNYKKGVNVTVTLPPLSNTSCINVKCYKEGSANFQSLIEEKAISKEASLTFQMLSILKENVLIIGKKNSAKTTLLSALTKSILPYQKAMIIDYNNEVKSNETNYTNYDFSSLEDEKTKTELINSIFAFNPDRVFVNDNYNDTDKYIKGLLSGYKGLVMTLEAKDKFEAMEKIAQSILRIKPYLSFQDAVKIAHELFKIVITTSRTEKGKRVISNLSEVNNYQFRDIFYLNENSEISSSGIVPDFYNNTGENMRLISANIFENSYIHTYKKSSDDLDNIKGINLLEKLKKKNVENLDTDETVEYKESSDDPINQDSSFE